MCEDNAISVLCEILPAVRVHIFAYLSPLAPTTRSHVCERLQLEGVLRSALSNPLATQCRNRSTAEKLFFVMALLECG